MEKAVLHGIRKMGGNGSQWINFYKDLDEIICKPIAIGTQQTLFIFFY